MVRRSQPYKTTEQKRLDQVVVDAKALLTYPGINWEDCCWDISAYEKPKAHRKRPDRLYFTIRRNNKSDAHVSYEQPFADFAKAIVRVRASDRGLSFNGHTHMIIAQRYLYNALKQTGTSDPTKLNRKMFAAAMSSAKSQAKGWTVYHVGRALQEISKWMDERELTSVEIDFLNPIPNPGRGDGLDPESQARGLLKMPSAAALAALADISNEPSDDDERIIMRIVDLLVVGGFRIGEVLSLPLDCWVEMPALNHLGKVKTDPRTGGQLLRYGIRYWPEKGGDPYIKWLADCAVPLAKRAVIDLTSLCASARAAAKALERTPNRVPLPVTSSSDIMVDHKQLTRIFGFKDVWYVNQLLTSIGVKQFARRTRRRGHPFVYRIRDIEKALLKRRGAIVIVKQPGGGVQMLSESLCVMFRNQFHAKSATLRFLPELIGEGQVNDALGNDLDQVSIFSVRGLTEPDGSPLRIKTSAFRHWLNTLLARGGLSDVELARWSGRRNIDQNAAYKHGTVEQRVSWAHNMIKEGTLRGPAADTYNSINDPVEKEQFLETFVNVALFTPYGVCIHDYAIDPCPYHLNCLSGCSEYLRTKGDRQEQKNIDDVRAFHLVQLQRTMTATQNDAGTVRNYEAHCERIVQGATAALAVDDDNMPDGQIVKVFPKGKVRGKAIRSYENGTA